MEVGPAEEVIRNPQHPYTQALLDAVPKFGHDKDAKRYGSLLTKDRDAEEDAGCAFFPRCAAADEDRCGGKPPDLSPLSDEHLVACFRLEAMHEA